jgi:hypothetical protein
MPETFDIETAAGIRRVEFDPDPLRSRDVRILVDGKNVLEMPYPTESSPHVEGNFELDGHSLVAIVYMSTEPTEDPTGLVSDLFAGGRSLSDGGSIEQARARAPKAGGAYPKAFRGIDLMLRGVPASASLGLFGGLSGAADELGWPKMISLWTAMLILFSIATLTATRVWAKIRADETRSVSERTNRGCGLIMACYIGAVIAGFAIAALVGAIQPEPRGVARADRLAPIPNASSGTRSVSVDPTESRATAGSPADRDRSTTRERPENRPGSAR